MLIMLNNVNYDKCTSALPVHIIMLTRASIRMRRHGDTEMELQTVVMWIVERNLQTFQTFQSKRVTYRIVIIQHGRSFLHKIYKDRPHTIVYQTEYHLQ